MENENGLGKFMEIKHWPKVMEFCYQSCNFTNFAPELYQICMCFFATTKKLSIDVGSLHFPTFSTKRCKCKSIRKMIMQN